jgi:hypothetical protein
MSVNPIVAVAVIAVWLYILSVLTRAKLYAWKFMWGSFGLFLIMMMHLPSGWNIHNESERSNAEGIRSHPKILA